MILACTAEEALWPERGPVLFLGEWCRLLEREPRWRELEHAVLPYPFDDRARLRRAYQRTNELYPKVVARLGTTLDQLLGERHSTRYWEIVVGYWVRTYLEVMYERSTCLEAAVEAGATRTRIPAAASTITPLDSLHFDRLYLGDRYNAQLYGDILRETRALDFEEVSLPPAADPGGIRRQARLRRWARRWAGGISLRLSRRNRYFMASCYFPMGAYVRLSAGMGQFPLLEIPRIESEHATPDAGARRALADIQADDAFERLAYRTLPTNLPLVFLEDYAALGRRAARALPRHPRAILTANAFAVDDAFKRWTAQHAEQGVPYGLIQHGGSYGCAAWNSSEDYEARTADAYYTYGWTDARPNVKPMPAARFVGRRARAHPAPGGDVLWVLASFPRYAYTMYSVPVGPQFLTYLDEQRRFYDALDPPARRRMLIRPYPWDYGWQDVRRIAGEGRALRVASLDETMHAQMRRAALFVATFNATAFMESMVEDIPTVMFWKPEHWELRADAEPHFDALRGAGILYDRPEAAAEGVLRALRDPTWWPATRPAREGFLERYGRTRPEAVKLWRAEIRRLGA